MLPTEPNQTPKAVYNPDEEDFTVEYLDDENIPHIYTVPKFQAKVFPTYLADYIIKHLSEKILWRRDVKVNVEEDLIKIRQEIENHE